MTFAASGKYPFRMSPADLVSQPVPELDHIGLYVRSMETSAQQYEWLGFRLTPLSQHSSTNPQTGEVSLAGIGNRCAMLRQGYIELVAVVDDSLDPRGVVTGLQRYEGIHILALRTHEAQAACNALRAKGFDARLGDLRRTIKDLPGGPQVARFTQIRTPADAMVEATVFMLSHETPELLWRDDLTEHPNGALSLDETLLLVSADFDAVVDRYARYLGTAAVVNGQEASFHLPHGVIRLFDPEAAAKRFSDLHAPDHSFPFGFVVGVRDLARTEQLLRANGVPVSRAMGPLPTEIQIAPAHACGAYLVFRQKESKS